MDSFENVKVGFSFDDKKEKIRYNCERFFSLSSPWLDFQLSNCRTVCCEYTVSPIVICKYLICSLINDEFHLIFFYRG